jgi:hypothetical protein
VSADRRLSTTLIGLKLISSSSWQKILNHDRDTNAAYYGHVPQEPTRRQDFRDFKHYLA